MPDIVFPTKASQISLLEEVLNTGAADWDTADRYAITHGGKHQKPPGGSNGPGRDGSMPAVQRSTARLEHLSGGQHLSYTERNKSLK